jgi:hypothetical protein
MAGDKPARREPLVNREILCRPFPPEAVKTRPGQHGKTLSYVDVATVIARLNEGCESWSFEVVSRRVDADEVIVVGKLTADGQTEDALRRLGDHARRTMAARSASPTF